MTELEIDVRDKLLEALKLDDVDPESVARDTVLFGEGLGLDSIDALEIEFMVKENYGIAIKTSERNRSTFGSFGDLCDFVRDNLNRDADKLATA